jgi:hypothetical protein
MKRIFKSKALLILTILSLLCLAFAAESFWNEITVTERNGKDVIFDNIKYGYISIPMIAQKANLKMLTSDRRTAIVQAIGDYIKEYVYSDEFKEKYLENGPTEPQKPVKAKTIDSSDQAIDESVAKPSDQIAQMEAMANNPGLPEETRAQLQKAVDDIKKSGAVSDDKYEQNKKDKKAEIQEENDNAQKQYDNDMVLYNKDKKIYDSLMVEYNQMSANFKPGVIMKNRLNDFLKLTETVDFNAKLVDKGDHFFAFEKPEYENKSRDWKFCFRAGKATIDAARSYAKAWLKEIESGN